MGEARNGACVGDLHHAWFLPNRPDLTVFGMNRALGVTAVSVRAEPAGLTRIRRRTYIPLTLPILDGSPRVIAARLKRTRCHGRRTDERRSPCAPCERLLHGVCCRRSALLLCWQLMLCWQLTPEPSSRSARVWPFRVPSGFVAYRFVTDRGRRQESADPV